jgi:hypothetical protein
VRLGLTLRAARVGAHGPRVAALGGVTARAARTLTALGVFAWGGIGAFAPPPA